MAAWATRWEVRITAAASSGSASSSESQCAFGITRACPRVSGNRSMNASVRSSSCTMRAGASPLTMAQKMQLLIGVLWEHEVPAVVAVFAAVDDEVARLPAEVVGLGEQVAAATAVDAVDDLLGCHSPRVRVSRCD